MTAMAIGAGANVVGGLLQAIAAAQAQKAMAKEFGRELDRQGKYSGQAGNVFQGSLLDKSAETAKEQIGQGAADRMARYSSIGNVPLGPNQNQTGRDKLVYGMTGQSRANLGGYGDWQLKRDVANVLSQNELNKIINFAGGTQSVFPYKMNEAQHSWDDLAFIGSLISSIGGGAGNFGELFQAPAMTAFAPNVGFDSNPNFSLGPQIDPNSGMFDMGTLFG